MKRGIKLNIVIFLSVAFLAILALTDVQLHYYKKIFKRGDGVKDAPVAIVLGASVKLNGEPSDALRDRLLVGQNLYERGVVKKILITGDDGKYHINEIKTMREFLDNLGVASEDIIEDGHGYRTYESCKRAIEVFNIRQAVVVTQRFHLGRALYLCNRLGMDATGVTADLTTYDRLIFFTLRDIAASFEAWWDINILPPKPPVEY
ncbi:YdcF family protein [Patescibacteria group bacterium]|nr:YdcF family protein [Patescibacteria group bacterium]